MNICNIRLGVGLLISYKVGGVHLHFKQAKPKMLAWCPKKAKS